MAWSDYAASAQNVSRSVLAEPAIYDPPPGGSPMEIFGEFDASAIQLELSNGVAVQTVGPRISVQLDELPGGVAAEGATIVVRGVSYTVTEIEPDGHGMALLRLVRV